MARAQRASPRSRACSGISLLCKQRGEQAVTRRVADADILGSTREIFDNARRLARRQSIAFAIPSGGSRAAPVLRCGGARLCGRDVITAFILGVSECRIETRFLPALRARLDITSTCGCSARLRPAPGCSDFRDGIANAIGLRRASRRALSENLPSAAKNVSVGNAARNGLFAALLCRAGICRCTARDRGDARLGAGHGRRAGSRRMLGDLGTSWEIAKNTYKPYPAGIVFHAVIDACFKLRARLDGRVDAIAAITVHGSALLLARGDRVVRNERDARVSIHHCAACALSLGSAGVPGIFGRGRDSTGHRQFAPEGDGRARCVLAGWRRARRCPMAVGRETRGDRDGRARQPRRSAFRRRHRSEAARMSQAWRIRLDGQGVIDAVWRLDTLAELSSLMSARAAIGPLKSPRSRKI